VWSIQKANNRLRVPGSKVKYTKPVFTQPGPRVSIVIPVHNEAHRLKETVLAVHEAADVSYEIIVVDDGSTDGCADFLEENPLLEVRLFRAASRLGVAGARNFGCQQARASVVMFMDGHCQPSQGFLSEMLRALYRLGRGLVVPQVVSQGDPTARGFGMTLAGASLTPVWLGPEFVEPYPVPVGCGCCQMFFRTWLDQIGHYDRMRTYGVEDLEISIRSWLLGGPVYVVPKAAVAHYFRSKTTCNVTWSDVAYNSLRMAHLHFSGARFERMVEYWRPSPAFAEAAKWLEASDVQVRRAWIDERRKHSADWYCEKFGII
jgi:GT2 family glycosyltransferase